MPGNDDCVVKVDRDSFSFCWASYCTAISKIKFNKSSRLKALSTLSIVSSRQVRTNIG